MNTRNTATGPTAMINLRFTMAPVLAAIEQFRPTRGQTPANNANLDRDSDRME